LFLSVVMGYLLLNFMRFLRMDDLVIVVWFVLDLKGFSSLICKFALVGKESKCRPWFTCNDNIVICFS
jgi:hypothetical protein